MAYIKPVINAACKQAQSKRLESQSKVSKITLDQAITQTQFILEHAIEVGLNSESVECSYEDFLAEMEQEDELTPKT